MPLSRNPEICAAELDGEMCLFNPEQAEYLNLNGTGSSIWNLLDAPAELEELICELQARYAVDPRADSKCQLGPGLGCRFAMASSAVMSCITACMPARID